jgi:hypothetical protein
VPEHVKSGFRRGGAVNRASLMAAEFRLQDARDEVKDLRRELIRLRADVRGFLEALPDDRAKALVRLREGMGRQVPRLQAVA